MRVEEVRGILSRRIHENDILELLYYRQEQKDIAEELIRCVFDEDAEVSRNALWVLTWDIIDRTEPLRSRLVALALTTPHVAIRRLSMTLLEKMKWDMDDVRVDFLDFCFEKMLSESEPPGVRALCIKLCYHLGRHYPELLDELKLMLCELADMPMSPAVACSRKNILNRIEKSRK